MKKCLVCGAIAESPAHACASCGSADWQPIVEPPPSHVAAAPSASPSREKRNKV